MQQSKNLVHIAYLHLGSNIGNRRDNLEKCIKALAERQIKILAQSLIYETEAWGNTDQASFLNIALKVETQLDPFELLKNNQRIEKDLGREKIEKWGPRIIDIDILFIDGFSINMDHLSIPHKEISSRRFVLKPMSDITKDYVHPTMNLTIAELLLNCADKSEVKLYNE